LKNRFHNYLIAPVKVSGANQQAGPGQRLAGFSVKLKKALEEMESAAIAPPGSKTDLLGSIALAEQEFQSSSDQLKRQFVILSDFIQEDREINFRKDSRIASLGTAREFAIQTARASICSFEGILIYLGLLRSSEMRI
jgi:hypothetical protein